MFQSERGGGHKDKLGMGRISYNKLTRATSDRPLLEVIIDGGGSNAFMKSGGMGVFVRGGGRRNDICVSRSVVVGGEAWRVRYHIQRLMETQY